jgi:diadenosine tetraphosphate (Ap4A) HIT family hydrolase
MRKIEFILQKSVVFLTPFHGDPFISFFLQSDNCLAIKDIKPDADHHFLVVSRMNAFHF